MKPVAGDILRTLAMSKIVVAYPGIIAVGPKRWASAPARPFVPGNTHQHHKPWLVRSLAY